MTELQLTSDQPVAEFQVGDLTIRYYPDSLHLRLIDHRVEVKSPSAPLALHYYQVEGFPVTQKSAEWWARKYLGETTLGYHDYTGKSEYYHAQCTPPDWLEQHRENKEFRVLTERTPALGGMSCTHCRGWIDYIPRK